MTERWVRELRNLRQAEPPPGLWERATILAGEETARRHLPRSAGSRRAWSAIAAAVAIALIAGAVFLVRGVTGVGEPPVGGHGGVYTDQRFGWSIRVPAGFLVHHITGEYRRSLDGVRVTFDLDMFVGAATDAGSGATAWSWPGPASSRARTSATSSRTTCTASRSSRRSRGRRGADRW